MRTEFYTTKAEKDNLKNQAHLIGESVIHDDFIDSNGSPTNANGKSGRLTFDVNAIPAPTADEATVRAIIDKINSDQSLNNVEERDFRKLYHLEGIR